MPAEPTVTCRLCNRIVNVNPYVQGFPPDVAKRTLRRYCNADGCPSDPQYMAGIAPELERIIRAR